MIIAAFDTETTGIPLIGEHPLFRQPKIIEIGIVLRDTDDETFREMHSALINPEQPLEQIITKITGLTDDDLKDQLTFAEYAKQERLKVLMQRCEMIFAHNMSFDKQMLELEAARLDSTIQDLFCFPDKAACTVELFQPIWGRRMKLIELYAWSFEDEKKLDQTHRAVDDAAALMEIIVNEECWRGV